ncbi:MAG: PDZ domain-containing protein [Firmicutes bacterium]|jgi:serine protease Do|nr:PDZ domain-containing protein [Bacillota bacterium]
MSFYDDFNEEPRRHSPIRRTVFVVGIILALFFAVLFFNSFMKNLRAEENNENPLAPLPGEEIREKEDDSFPETAQYYLAVVDAVEKATPSVVGISNYGIVFDFWGQSSLRERATGSGVIIRSDGYIVTNYHVIENAEELVVTLGSGEEFTATIIGADPPTDLAVIKIDKTGLPAAEFANSEKLRVGEPAIAIGNPLGLDFQQSVTLGVVSARERSITIQGQKFTFIQTDAAINDGNSGGALVNINGKLIGINTAKIKITGVEGMGFAIPSNTVREIAEDLIENGRVIRPWIGISTRNLTRLEARQLGLDVDYGVIVMEIVAGSPAERAGLEPMDIIVALEGDSVTNISELQQLIYRYKVGQKVTLTVYREKRQLELEVTLDKMP